MPSPTLYRVALPHWRVPGSCYFVTFRLRAGQPDLRSEERTVVQNALLHFDKQRYQLDAYVVMNDHVHALVRPADDVELQRVLHSWKSFTSHALQRGMVWQKEYFDRIIRSESDWLEKLSYIAGNPLKRWPDCEGYLWVHPRIEAG